MMNYVISCKSCYELPIQVKTQSMTSYPPSVIFNPKRDLTVGELGDFLHLMKPHKKGLTSGELSDHLYAVAENLGLRKQDTSLSVPVTRLPVFLEYSQASGKTSIMPQPGLGMLPNSEKYHALALADR